MGSLEPSPGPPARRPQRARSTVGTRGIADVRVSVLGPVEVRVSGEEVALRPLERRILAALSVERAGLRHEQLADALWGDALPATAIHSLQTHVVRTRRAVGADAIVTVDGGYRLDTAAVLDADEFAAAIEDAGTSRGPRWSERWARALGLWRGRPLPELDEWYPATVERARLEELFLVASEEACAAAIVERPAVDVVAAARALAEAEPLRERRWAILMQALDATGRRAEALRTFDRARRVLATELGISPGRELDRLHRALLQADDGTHDGTGSAIARARPPAATSRLIGRDVLLTEVERRLADHRCVTLTGPGGIGKTRVALELAARAGGEVASAGLAPLTPRDDVDAVVGHAIGATSGAGRSARDAIEDAVAARAVLLVLDNCEHVAEAVADLVCELLTRCPGLTVLATSRSALGIDGEQLVAVPPLPPEPACELLVERVSAAGASIGDADASGLAAVAERLSGIPLAIELAATHVRSLGLHGVAARLADRVDVASSPRAGRVNPHGTMREAIAWSHDLLAPADQEVFAALSVFADEFELDAAAHVAPEPSGGADVVGAVTSLVGASMAEVGGGEPVRYRLLHPIRAFAAERLDERGDTLRMHARHAAYYAERAASYRIALDGPDEIAAVRWFDASRGELRAVFGRAAAAGDVDTALRVAEATGSLAASHIWPEPWAWCDAAAALPGARDHPLRSAVLVRASEGAWQRGEYAGAVARADEVIELSASGSETWLDAHRARSAPLLWLGRVDEGIESAEVATRHGRGEVLTAPGLSREATRLLILNAVGQRRPEAAQPLLAAAHRIGNPTRIALAHHVAGALVGPDDARLALELQRVAATVAAESGATLIEGFALAALSSYEADDPVRAARATVEVMAHFQRAGNRAHVRSFAHRLGELFRALGDSEAAALVEGATAGQPDLAPGKLHRPAPSALTVGSVRVARMSDEELVGWLDDRVLVHELRLARVDAPARPGGTP